MLEVLRTAPELCGEDVEVRIAIAELVCYVGYAAAVCEAWGGEIVAYATDNMNVRMWLASRKARAPLARHLLRILGMLEARYRFRTLAFYIRTYHNVTADWVSRESKEVVEEELLRRGWKKVPRLARGRRRVGVGALHAGHGAEDLGGREGGHMACKLLDRGHLELRQEALEERS